MKSACIKVIYVLIMLSGWILSCHYWVASKNSSRHLADEDSTDLIGLIILRTKIPPSCAVLTDQINIELYIKLVQTQLRWNDLDKEKQKLLAKTFPMLKSAWLREPPLHISDETLNFVSDTCKVQPNCPPGNLHSR